MKTVFLHALFVTKRSKPMQRIVSHFLLVQLKIQNGFSLSKHNNNKNKFRKTVKSFTGHYKCTECHVSFMRGDSYRAHMRLHEKTRNKCK